MPTPRAMRSSGQNTAGVTRTSPTLSRRNAMPSRKYNVPTVTRLVR
jgi:hypothetical protein